MCLLSSTKAKSNTPLAPHSTFKRRCFLGWHTLFIREMSDPENHSNSIKSTSVLVISIRFHESSSLSRKPLTGRVCSLGRSFFSPLPVIVQSGSLRRFDILRKWQLCYGKCHSPITKAVCDVGTANNLTAHGGMS